MIKPINYQQSNRTQKSFSFCNNISISSKLSSIIQTKNKPKFLQQSIEQINKVNRFKTVEIKWLRTHPISFSSEPIEKQKPWKLSFSQEENLGWKLEKERELWAKHSVCCNTTIRIALDDDWSTKKMDQKMQQIGVHFHPHYIRFAWDVKGRASYTSYGPNGWLRFICHSLNGFLFNISIN